MSDPKLRDAASLLLARASTSGDLNDTRVLMGLRGAGHRFMPNRLVFPGGAVDPADHTAPLANAPPDHVLDRLTVDADASLAHALVHACARELHEETGLHLGIPPNLAELDYLCRAVTPSPAPIRFDARFLVIDANHAKGSLAGSGELEDLRWYSLSEALALDLAFPTRKVLEQYSVFLALDAQARTARRLTPTLRERYWVME